MLSKIKSQLANLIHGDDSDRDFTSARSSQEVYQTIHQAGKAKAELSEFIGNPTGETKFVSLGENCSSAWYLKQVGLKDASYPFDWVFSSPDIILDCLEDSFSKYLDRDLIVPKRRKGSAGHAQYHDDLFNHRNPLASEANYDYLKRCCERLSTLVASQQPSCYLITLINEPEKRVNWAKGFDKQFAMPRNQGLESVAKLKDYLKAKNQNTKFVVVDHYTERENSVEYEKVDDDVFFIRFDAQGKSTGVLYENAFDDFCFKLIMTGLYGK
ncbi:DUF1796 family putative cysteine peptidase [Grimontia sp. SpTr1]|uniref:DUF1796 family putative cysteine peptidase n=1 Tax=Grimontia sp. SpTr1 TaxID=2995319 RepID=UPI00248CCD65|nr:DUF1796 family putative cysteine peptidase [Grimontia sp. SpTr1]